jgi:hypothetical protein
VTGSWAAAGGTLASGQLAATTADAPAHASGYDKIEPQYSNLPGWKTSTEGITKFEKLPNRAQEYLAFLEKEAGAKIGMVSTGPDRDHTIFVGREPLKFSVAGFGMLRDQRISMQRGLAQLG